jgi:hypothetical protein
MGKCSLATIAKTKEKPPLWILKLFLDTYIWFATALSVLRVVGIGVYSFQFFPWVNCTIIYGLSFDDQLTYFNVFPFSASGVTVILTALVGQWSHLPSFFHLQSSVVTVPS